MESTRTPDVENITGGRVLQKLHGICNMPIRVTAAKVCDARDDDSSNAAGQIKFPQKPRKTENSKYPD